MSATIVLDPKAKATEVYQQLRVELSLFRGDDDRLYFYDDELGYYRPQAALKIAEVIEAAGRPLRDAEEVTRWLKTAWPQSAVSDPGTVNFANGILDLATGELLPHSPVHLHTRQIPWNYDPAAPLPERSVRFLRRAIPDDATRRMFLEMLGYAMTNQRARKAMLVIVGPGDSGKSQLLHLLNGLVGDENVTSSSLKDLTDDKFHLGRAARSLVNSAAELSETSSHETEIIKKLSGGDRVSARDPYGSAYEVQPTTLLAFATNAIPYFKDSSTALTNRMHIIPMAAGQVVRPDDPDYVDEIGKVLAADTAEMEGLVRLAISLYRESMPRNAFTLSEQSADARQNLRNELNSVEAFVQERCEIGVGFSTSRADFKDRYERWCEEEGREPVKRGLTAKAAAVDPGVSESKQRGVRVLKGLHIRPSTGLGI